MWALPALRMSQLHADAHCPNGIYKVIRVYGFVPLGVFNFELQSLSLLVLIFLP